MQENQRISDMCYPIYFKMSLWKKVGLFSASILTGFISLMLFSIPSYNSDWLVRILAWVLAVLFLQSMVSFTLRVLDSHVFNLYEEGIELRHVGFVKWKDIQRIGYLSPVIIFFEFDYSESMENKIPFYIRRSKGLFRRQDNFVYIAFDISGLREKPLTILATIAKVYTIFLAKSLGLDLNKKIEDLDKQKMDIFTRKVKEVFQDQPSDRMQGRL